MLQYCKVAKLQSYKVAKLQSCKVVKLQVAGLQSCKVAKLQSYKVTTLQSYKVAKLQSCKVQRWKGAKLTAKNKLVLKLWNELRTDGRTGGFLELLSQLKIILFSSNLWWEMWTAPTHFGLFSMNTTNTSPRKFFYFLILQRLDCLRKRRREWWGVLSWMMRCNGSQKILLL